MADEDISLTEDQLLENLDDGNNGDSEFLNEVHFFAFSKFYFNDELREKKLHRTCDFP